jgi:hypothetical protein
VPMEPSPGVAVGLVWVEKLVVTYIRAEIAKRDGTEDDRVYSRETKMPQSNRDPSTPETGEQVPA